MNSRVKSFIETGLWATLDIYSGDDDYNPPLDEKYSIDDVSMKFQHEADAFIDAFLERAGDLLTDADHERGHIEYDLWLTVEGHSAGFWDGDYEHGDALTAIVKDMQPYDFYWDEKLNEAINRESKKMKNTKQVKYTPGPWKLGSPHGLKDNDGKFIGEPCQSIFANDEKDSRGPTSIATTSKANAALIAAAPDLLECLEAVFFNYGIEGLSLELNDRIIETLKKARGVA